MALEQEIWTTRSILEWTHQYFQSKEIPSPRLDAELLLAFVCQCSRVNLYLAYDKPLSTEERAHYRTLVKKRGDGAPVAYLIGEKGFWALNLFIEEGVLIPRPDTETLVEQACKLIQEWQDFHQNQTCTILEVGTGTAAIPLALCNSLKNVFIISTDISDIAIKVASKNIEQHHHLLSPRSNQINLIRGDRFEMLDGAAEFDIILSNPPYIPTGEIAQLQKEIVRYEPIQALDGGADGLDFYRYFFQHSAHYLKPDGQILLEIGYNQLPMLQEILPDYLKLNQVVQDLQSHPRVCHLKRCA
ncbi:MAG: peptide chain release factor N(5)-glutamine methyltransferase [SAR324 cluster bacterium]|nr:peptide chain release factor N(5)-glutamine methyltransferase [SAR324 cluster bacterium]